MSTVDLDEVAWGGGARLCVSVYSCVCLCLCVVDTRAQAVARGHRGPGRTLRCFLPCQALLELGGRLEMQARTPGRT